MTLWMLMWACSSEEATPEPTTGADTEADPTPVPASPALCLTELVADNVTTAVDTDGGHPDWVELHNPTEQVVSLAGWSLSDEEQRMELDLRADLQPGEHRVLFLYDGGPRLSAEGDRVTLHAPDGTEHAVTFGALPPDMAAFREGEGCDGPWTTGLGGTPGAPNVPPAWLQRIVSGSTARWHADPPPGWEQADFDDSGWTTMDAGTPQGTERVALRWSVPRPSRERVAVAVAFADGVRVWLDGAEVFTDHLDEDGHPPEALVPPRLGAWRGSLHPVPASAEDDLVVAAEAIAFDPTTGGAWLDLTLDAAEDP